MAGHDILIEAAERAARGRAFVLATVVRRLAPSSARPAQKALVLPDGAMRGWIGGSCIEPIVRREGLEALKEGRPRRVVLAPEATGASAGDAEPDLHAHPMTCHSGGTVEILLEPYLPAPLLELYGDSPVTEALAAMAPALGWRVERWEDPDAEGPESPEAGGGDGLPTATRLAVVATMGVWDESAAARALTSGARYVGLVASPKRTAEVLRRLAERGLSEEEMSRLVGPAGLDLGAESPAEIAITILAQIVGRRELFGGGAEVPSEGAAGATDRAEPPALAVDPVCGMEVDPATARFTLSVGEREYFFCCEGCREKFGADPAAFGAA
jgi:xanthine dehydrogenase accessory factor